jgi:hypothetical protein
MIKRRGEGGGLLNRIELEPPSPLIPSIAPRSKQYMRVSDFQIREKTGFLVER